MQFRHAAAAVVALILLITTHAHDITQILNKFPEFSTFNQYLTATQLAPEINRRETITVCAVDNATMVDLLSMNLTIPTIRNILSVHVILDYFDADKLHEITDGTALAATIFQASGSAPGSTGMVNITELRGGKVAFFPEDNNGVVVATFVKSIKAIPYNISVIQISAILLSDESKAPAPPQPRQTNIQALMSAHGCKVFAETLVANSAQQTFERNVGSGLTIFCPEDDAMEKFMPIYNKLGADSRQSLLEYHGMPVYEPLNGLKWNNGVMTTLATDGAKKYDVTVQNVGENVMIMTGTVTAKIDSNLIDQKPLAIFRLDRVLMPMELFNSGLSPIPAPAQAPTPVDLSPIPAPAPTPQGESPANGPGEDVADQTLDTNGAHKMKGLGFGALIQSMECMLMLVILFSSLLV